jgi:hypothetical protein
MNVSKKNRVSEELVLAAFERNAGNVRATAAELGIARSTVRRTLAPLGAMKKPLAAGSIEGVKAEKQKLPATGEVRRYILTSAQNNTYVHDSAWQNLLALAEHYDAQIIVGTYTYNQNRYGKLSVKRGKDKQEEKQLWYDPKVIDYIQDVRVQLAPGLVWCGEMNILPTAVNPLAGLESYTGRASAIFPHAKLAMRSIATMQGEGVKLNYTTGTVTQRNYIQKREGVIAEFHHIYGGLLVEVNSNGNWWVRQLNQDDDTDTMQDLDVLAKAGKCHSARKRVEAITFGDLHGTFADPGIVKVSHEMLDNLQPRFQFLHDILEGASINPHIRKHKDNHAKFHIYLRGYSRLDAELKDTVALLESYDRKFAKTVIVDSNHDDAWLHRWLTDYDYRVDPANAELFLDLQTYMYGRIRGGDMPRDISMIEYAMTKAGYKAPARFLLADESYLICGKKIECGQHGHLGPAGRRGSPDNLSKMGRKANTAHTHSTGIYNGLYVAGTSSKLRWDYNLGPSSWTNSHIVTYPNGKRSIITIYADQWRA